MDASTLSLLSTEIFTNQSKPQQIDFRKAKIAFSLHWLLNNNNINKMYIYL